MESIKKFISFIFIIILVLGFTNKLEWLSDFGVWIIFFLPLFLLYWPFYDWLAETMALNQEKDVLATAVSKREDKGENYHFFYITFSLQGGRKETCWTKKGRMYDQLDSGDRVLITYSKQGQLRNIKQADNIALSHTAASRDSGGNEQRKLVEAVEKKPPSKGKYHITFESIPDRVQRVLEMPEADYKHIQERDQGYVVIDNIATKGSKPVLRYLRFEWKVEAVVAEKNQPNPGSHYIIFHILGLNHKNQKWELPVPQKDFNLLQKPERGNLIYSIASIAGSQLALVYIRFERTLP